MTSVQSEKHEVYVVLKSMLYSDNNTINSKTPAFFTGDSGETSASKLIQIVGQILFPVL